MADPIKKTRKGLFGRTITKSTDSAGNKTRTVSRTKGNVTRVKEKVKGNTLGERYKRKSKEFSKYDNNPENTYYSAKISKTKTGRGRNKVVNETISQRYGSDDSTFNVHYDKIKGRKVSKDSNYRQIEQSQRHRNGNKQSIFDDSLHQKTSVSNKKELGFLHKLAKKHVKRGYKKLGS